MLHLKKKWIRTLYKLRIVNRNLRLATALYLRTRQQMYLAIAIRCAQKKRRLKRHLRSAKHLFSIRWIYQEYKRLDFSSFPDAQFRDKFRFSKTLCGKLLNYCSFNDRSNTWSWGKALCTTKEFEEHFMENKITVVASFVIYVEGDKYRNHMEVADEFVDDMRSASSLQNLTDFTIICGKRLFVGTKMGMRFPSRWLVESFCIFVLTKIQNKDCSSERKYRTKIVRQNENTETLNQSATRKLNSHFRFVSS